VIRHSTAGHAECRHGVDLLTGVGVESGGGGEAWGKGWEDGEARFVGFYVLFVHNRIEGNLPLRSVALHSTSRILERFRIGIPCAVAAVALERLRTMGCGGGGKKV